MGASSIAAFVRGQQQDGGQHQAAAEPAVEAEIFLPEQPDPEGAQHRLQMAGDRRAHQADAFEALAVAGIGEKGAGHAQHGEPEPDARLMVETYRHAEPEREHAPGKHEAVNGGRGVAALPPAVKRIVRGVTEPGQQAAGNARKRALSRQAAAGKADQGGAGQGHADGPDLARRDPLPEEQAGKHGHPDRRGVQQHHGHSRAAELDGVLGGPEKDAHAPDPEEQKDTRVAGPDEQALAQHGVDQEQRAAKGRAPEGGFQRADPGAHADFGNHPDQRPEKGRQQNPGIAAQTVAALHGKTP